MTTKQYEILIRCHNLLLEHFSDRSLSEKPEKRLQTQESTMNSLGEIADQLLKTCRGED